MIKGNKELIYQIDLLYNFSPTTSYQKEIKKNTPF